MSESFVDLAYRGLSLGRRIRLSQIRPSSGYLELPTPMPVGTKIALATDEGVAIDAVVTHIHEQVGGTDRPPGMMIAPALAEGAAAAWWQQRVALPELEVPEPRSVTVLPRGRTPTGSPPLGAVAAAAPAAAAPAAPAPASAAPAGSAPAGPAPADPAVAAPASAGAPAAASARPGEGGEAAEAEAPAALDPEALGEGDPPLVDDGKRTVMMHSVDLHALGLEAGASGQFAASAALAAADEADAGEPDEGEGGESEASADDAAAAGESGEPRRPAAPEGGRRPAGRKRKKRR